MPTTVPVSTKVTGDVFSLAMWNNQIRDNINKLLNTGHRVLTVAQFGALVSPEGTKGTVAPDEVYLEVDSTNGVQWHLAYESGEATYKWRFLGGPPMVSEVLTSESTSSITYAALATAGPSIAIPRSGDYDVTLNTQATAAAAANALMSYDIGGTGAVDTDAILVTVTNAGGGATQTASRIRRKTALTAITLTAKYKSPGAVSDTFANRLMTVTPVRLV